MLRIRLLLSALVFFAFGRIAFADATLHFGPPAAWVEPVTLPSLMATPVSDASYGYDYLLLERQTNVREQSVYYHNIYRLTSDSTLQSGARFTWSFDPGYERLDLHHLRVIRDGVAQDRLRPADIQLIQQERELDRHMLDGRLTALLILADIRVGDVIDYAFTRTGWNPTFDGRYFDRMDAGWSVPVRRERYRVRFPGGRWLQYRAHGSVPLTLTTSRDGEDQILQWEASDLRPIESEKEVPDWFETYPFLQLTEFGSWADVVRWAEPLYALPDPLPDEIRAQAARVTQGATGEPAKVAAILRFVQQEVRYLGLELGAGSYRPNPPAVVLARRYGDCKDKTLLCCALLRAVGVTAYPALLHTDYRWTLDRWLPSAHAFDHVIVCLPAGKGFAWADPTLTHQEGELGRRGLPNYGRALIVQPGNDRLATVEVPAAARPTVRVEESFEIAAFDRPARFLVKTHYTGTSADSMRRYLAQDTPEQIAKDYVNYYASTYPGIRSLDPITWKDDAEANRLTVDETYEVPELWREQSDPRTLKAEFYPKNIADYATRPNAPVRSMPLAVNHPVDAQLTTTVHLPEDWTVTPKENVVEDKAFRATDAISGDGRIVKMTYSWESRRDHVPTDEVAKHVDKLMSYRNGLGYTLTYKKPDPNAPPPVAPSFRLNWKLTLVTLILFGGAGYVASILARREPAAPPALEPDRTYCGLRGWLLLVGFGVTVRPIYLLVVGVKELHASFDLRVWEAMTLPGGTAYQPWLGPLIVAELAGDIVMLVGGVLLVVLFYRRRQLFPAVFIFMMAFTAVFIAADYWAAKNLITGGGGAAQDVVRTVVPAAVWIPYMRLSRRVKATFTR